MSVMSKNCFPVVGRYPLLMLLCLLFLLPEAGACGPKPKPVQASSPAVKLPSNTGDYINDWGPSSKEIDSGPPVKGAPPKTPPVDATGAYLRDWTDNPDKTPPPASKVNPGSRPAPPPIDDTDDYIKGQIGN